MIHSFFIPDFRVKSDLPPGRYTTLWFEPKGVGTHQVFCTEYCGDGHSGMLAKVFVMTQKDYKDWMEKGPKKPDDLSLPEWGKKLYSDKTCNTCHSIDGSPLTGPSFKGIFGKPQALTSGKTVTVDADFISKSILNPAEDVAVGFNPVMPSYQGLIGQEEMKALIAYIESLK